MTNKIFAAKNEVRYILTSKLQTDAIENLFSQIRSRGGNNFNPSVFEFNFIVAKIMTNRLICNSSSLNYQPDNCKYLIESQDITPCQENIEIDSEPSNSNFTYSEEDFNEIAFVDQFTNENHKIDLPSVRYFVGYVIYKLIHKSQCEMCNQLMVKSDEQLLLPSEYLIKSRNYLTPSEELYLKNPTDYFFELSYIHIKIFELNFKENIHKKNILQFLLEKCIDATNRNPKYLEWFTGSCKDHKIKTLKFLLLVLIRKNCSWQLQKLKEENISKGKKFMNSNSKARRLRILNE